MNAISFFAILLLLYSFRAFSQCFPCNAVNLRKFIAEHLAMSKLPEKSMEVYYVFWQYTASGNLMRVHVLWGDFCLCKLFKLPDFKFLHFKNLPSYLIGCLWVISVFFFLPKVFVNKKQSITHNIFVTFMSMWYKRKEKQLFFCGFRFTKEWEICNDHFQINIFVISLEYNFWMYNTLYIVF